jgi:hypothetical protein
MLLAEKMDEFGRGGWIVATVLGFWLFWPVGLAVLAFVIGSGRVRSWRRGGPGRWYYHATSGAPESGVSGNGSGGGWARGCGGWRRRSGPPPSGNHAFDDYRTETLRRLEAEQQEFVEYLERLRRAKDKAEFDQFMDERRPRPPAPDYPAPGQPAG